MIFATFKMRAVYGTEVTINTLQEEFETAYELEHFLAYNRAAILDMKLRGRITRKEATE
jgi:hypothetical protein